MTPRTRFHISGTSPEPTVFPINHTKDFEMKNADNHQPSANADAVSQLVLSYLKCCQTELLEASSDKAEEHKLHDKRLEILDALIGKFGLEHASLVRDIFQEVLQHQMPELSSMAEDVCQLLQRQYGHNGAVLALQLRERLTAHQLANPVTLFNLALQKLVGVHTKKDPVGAHRLVELVLKRVQEPSRLRTQALLQSAMNFVDGEAVAVDLEKAHARLFEAAHIGSPEAAYNLGLFYSGRFCSETTRHADNNLAATYYAIAQSKGHLQAQTNLALLHVQGLISDPNPKLGWELLRDASEKGDQVARKCIEELTSPD